ncbi:MAG: hypothetical protein ACI90V_013284, partial [Bacillariaceae sp.]
AVMTGRKVQTKYHISSSRFGEMLTSMIIAPISTTHASLR